MARSKKVELQLLELGEINVLAHRMVSVRIGATCRGQIFNLLGFRAATNDSQRAAALAVLSATNRILGIA